MNHRGTEGTEKKRPKAEKGSIAKARKGESTKAGKRERKRTSRTGEEYACSPLTLLHFFVLSPFRAFAMLTCPSYPCSLWFVSLSCPSVSAGEVGLVRGGDARPGSDAVADALQALLQRPQEQEHALRPAVVAHDADAPDLTLEVAQAAAHLDAELVQQPLA